MKRNNLLVLLLGILFISCSEPPTGIAHKGIKEAYPFAGFGTNVYSESMIRAALNLAKTDSTHQVSSNTHYVLTFEMDKTARWRNVKEDSIVRHHITESEAELLAEYSQKETSMSLYGLIDENTVYDLMLIDNSKTAFKVYEFVGKMPLQTLLQTGVNNFDDIRNLIIPTPNAGTDSTNV